jgi:uncharacterized RDD family membrane protein YckC
MDDIFNKPVTLSYAGFWIRFCAYIVDMIIAGAIATILSRMLFGNYYSAEAYKDPGPGAVSLLVSWLYFAFQESSVRQATFGKLAFGLRVCSETGERLSFANATGRYFAKIISAIILLIGFIMIAFDSRKQGLHDKIAHTLVVRG